MVSNIIFGIIGALIIILVIFLIMISFNKPKAGRLRNDTFTLESLTYSPGISKVVDVLIPKSDDKEYKNVMRLISDSGINVSIRVVYFMKLIIPLILIIIALSIYFTNREMIVESIILETNTKKIDVFADAVAENGNQELNSKEKREREQAKKDMFEIMDNYISYKILAEMPELEAKTEISKALMDAGAATQVSAAYEASNLYNKALEVYEARKVNIVTILFILMFGMCGFMVPNLYLEGSKFIRYQAFDNEVIALEMLTILVGSIENITVKDILKILAQNSKVFQKNFEKCLAEYPADFELALNNLANSSKNKDFQSLVSTLRNCATSDKYAALQVLQRRRLSRKEYRKMQEEKKIETKMYIGFILLMPVLFFLAKLVMTPWMDLMNSGIL